MVRITQRWCSPRTASIPNATSINSEGFVCRRRCPTIPSQPLRAGVKDAGGQHEEATYYGILDVSGVLTH